MNRHCPFCNVSPEIVVKQKWYLPGLDKSFIGFSICNSCGFVFQSPTLSKTDVEKYYTDIATYINPGRKGKPTERKVKDVKRLIHLTEQIIGNVPKSAFQVGCSDGYTLNEFRNAGVEIVHGIDPSIASHNLAKELYPIETIIGNFENFDETLISDRYELIILTHILEHLFDPGTILRKCCNLQNESDWLLIEVPLFENIDFFSPGILSFEHLNYFTESKLVEIVTLAKYEPRFIGKYFGNNLYPVITVLAKKNSNIIVQRNDDRQKSKQLLMEYVEREKHSWMRIEKKIHNRTRKKQKTYIYGAGIHTSQLLASTDIESHLEIVGLMDSSPTKWGKKFGKWNCYKPDPDLVAEDETIIISSFASENEIYNNLILSFPEKDHIIRLYND